LEKKTVSTCRLVVVKDKNRFPLAELELWKFPLAEPVIMKEKTLSTCGTCYYERKQNWFLLAELDVIEVYTCGTCCYERKKTVSTCKTCCYERKNQFPLAELVAVKEKTVSTCGTSYERKTGFLLRNLLL
jgi:hypothetical protein